MAAKNFTDVVAWQIAYKLAIAVYKVTADFPKQEQYGLTSQLRRAAVSVSSKIAEGFGRTVSKEKDQFYAIGRGSLTEVQNLILVAKGVGYLKEARYHQLEDLCTESIKVLSGLQKANRQKGA